MYLTTAKNILYISTVSFLREYGMRILGLDYGTKRIGVALCDELGLTGQGLTTIVWKNRNQVLNALEVLVRNHSVEKIVIGYPLRLDGTEGIQCEKVNRFVRLLEARLSIPVIKWDETLSTQTAEEILIQSGVHREKRKKIVDKLAAGIILQGYLNSLHPSSH